MIRHPDQDEISNRGKGPAKIVYKDGETHFTKNLAYTTCLKYVTTEGRPVTSKGTSIKFIEWLDEGSFDDA